jgi:hypothetical protein
MTEQVPHELFNFDAMPLTNEQKILETLLRIEALLAPKAQVVAEPVEVLTQGRQPGGILRVKGRK